MKNNVIGVPEGFFEQSQNDILKECAAVRHRRRIFAGALCTLAIILAGSLAFYQGESSRDLMTEAEADEIIEIYECDIFLSSLTF